MSEVVAERRTAPGAGGHGLRWWREVLYGVVIYAVYSWVRNQFGSATGDAQRAFENAMAIIDWQRGLGLYFERDLQAWYLSLPGHGLIRAWNAFYGTAHFVVTFVALVWLFRAAPSRYRLWRNTLALTTCVALVGFAAFPLMPPRLLDDPGRFGGCQVYAPEAAAAAPPGTTPAAGCDRFGYVDTVAEHGGWASFGSEQMAAVSNQWAAMPSMHVGWSIWSALVLTRLARRRWVKATVAAYPAVTTFCIMITGNHWWLDGAGGAAALGVGFALATAVTRRR